MIDYQNKKIIQNYLIKLLYIIYGAPKGGTGCLWSLNDVFGDNFNFMLRFVSKLVKIKSY